MNLLLPSEVAADSAAGGKAKALAALSQAGLPVPDWFVVMPEAFGASLGTEAAQRLAAATNAEDIATLLTALQPSDVVGAAILERYRQLCPAGEPVAVRSSAAEEDSAALSFAGQLESFLFVEADDLLRRIADVWRSGFSERIIAYRRNAGLPPMPDVPAVIVQRVVDGDVSGVAFSCDPVSGRRSIAVVAAVPGLGQALVSGAADSDTWHVDRSGRVIERQIAAKTNACRRDPDRPDRLVTAPLDASLAAKPSLDDEQVARVAALARAAERHFGRPQDVEWTLTGAALYLLQSRPVTTLADRADPDGQVRLWDNTNIIESYGGITLPLTFSFVRRCYEQVYRQFCALMRVPVSVIDSHADVFSNLLGLLNGRVYYNLLNGYRVLTLLPAYRLNRRFTEEMLGFRDTLPPAMEAELEREAVRAKVGDLIHLARTAGGVLWNLLTIDQRVAAFYRRLHRVLPEHAEDLSDRTPDELVRRYRSLESTLLQRWDAPQINDFFAAIWHGTLRRLTKRWLGDRTGALHNALLCGDRRLVGMQIAAALQHMSEVVSRHAELRALLRTGSRAAIEARLRELPELERPYREYLDRFGDRCLDELKLESATVRDDPLPLLRAVAGYGDRIAGGEAAESELETRMRSDAEAQVTRGLRGHPLRRVAFAWVLEQTRRRVRCRENLRFERTRAFGAVRRIAVELGRRFAALNLLNDPHDVFYLTLDEVLAVVEGTAVTTRLNDVTAVRRAEYERYRALPALPARFQTRGVPYIGNQFLPSSAPCEEIGGARRHGIGCCPGLVRGTVRVIEDPRGASIAPGTIIVARRTDPGWVILFPAAAGLLVERGSMLSHSAIVAREMGLPAIVSIPGLVEWLADGDVVEMDGASGEIVRVEPKSPRNE